jgi:hypothetical protein
LLLEAHSEANRPRGRETEQTFGEMTLEQAERFAKTLDESVSELYSEGSR